MYALKIGYQLPQPAQTGYIMGYSAVTILFLWDQRATKPRLALDTDKHMFICALD